MSNKISAACKQCHKTYKVPIQFIGKTIHCKCGHRFKCSNTAPAKAFPPASDSRGTIKRHRKDQRESKHTKPKHFFTPRKLIAKNVQALNFDTVFIRKHSTHIGVTVLLLSVLALTLLIAKIPQELPDQPPPDFPQPKTSDLIDSALKSVVTLMGTTSRGSGFLFQDSQTIVTNLHVVKNQKRMVARFDDGRTVPISGWYEIAPEYDLALLRLASPTPRQPLPIFSGIIKSGMRIFTIGAPAGLGFTVTDGLVSATRDGNDLKAIGPLDAIETNSKWIQFSAPISSGNSGGPLILENGQAIGVNTMVSISNDGKDVRQNLNFAIHIDHAIDLYKQSPRQARSFDNLP